MEGEIGVAGSGVAVAEVAQEGGRVVRIIAGGGVEAFVRLLGVNQRENKDEN